MARTNYGDKGLTTFTFGFVGLAALLILASIGFAVYTSAHTEDYHNCTVADKDRGGNEGGMRVYTENCGTFSVSDSIMHGKYDSADRYAAIKVGSTYDFHTNNMRIEFFSMFPNILEATEVS